MFAWVFTPVLSRCTFGSRYNLSLNRSVSALHIRTLEHLFRGLDSDSASPGHQRCCVEALPVELWLFAWAHCLAHFTLCASTGLPGARCREASSQQDAPTMIHAGGDVFMTRCSATWCLVRWPKSSVLVSSDHKAIFQLTSESLSYKSMTGEAPGQLLLSDWLDCLTRLMLKCWFL